MSTYRNLNLYKVIKEKQKENRNCVLNTKRGIDLTKNTCQQELFDLLYKLKNSETFCEDDFCCLIQNLEDPNNCIYLLNAGRSFDALIKYITGTDNNLRLFAIKCVSLLLQVNDEYSYKIARTTCPILTCFLRGLNYKITVICVQVLGNLSTSSLKIWEILYSQNILLVVLNLLNSSNEEVIQKTLVCVSKFLKIGIYKFRIEELNLVLDKCITFFDKHDSVHWIVYQLSSVKNYLSTHTIIEKFTIEIINYLQTNDKLSTVSGTGFIRTLANIVACDQDGEFAKHIITNNDLIFSKCSKLMTYHHFVLETQWLIGNLLNHPNQYLHTLTLNNDTFKGFIESFC